MGTAYRLDAAESSVIIHVGRVGLFSLASREHAVDVAMGEVTDGSGWRIALGMAIGLACSWGVLVVFLLVARPRTAVLQEALRLLPDTLRLLRRLAVDRTLPRSARLRLWLLFAYLAMPIDVIPDFMPVIGYLDDAILVCLVLRSIVRPAGPSAIRRHWPGTADGLATLWRAAGLPGDSA